jgi:hypothetical protein
MAQSKMLSLDYKVEYHSRCQVQLLRAGAHYVGGYIRPRPHHKQV